MLNIKKQAVKITAASILVGTCLAGCGGASLGGGSTTCGEFKALDKSGKETVIKNFLSESGDSDPANLTVLATRGSAELYCSTVGSDSDPISNING